MKKNIELIGFGSYVPERIIKNTDLEKLVDTSDEWIQQRTGISERRITKGENTSVLASKAAKAALDDAGVKVDEVDLIIVATTTPDYFFPSTACLVQKELGLNNATAFDISAACTGFAYALDIGISHLSSERFETALIIGADLMSKIVDWEDRNTCVLFGDGAGAVVVRKTNEDKIVETYTKSNGSKEEVLRAPAHPVIDIESNEKEMTRGVTSMNGGEVFKFACTVVPETITELLNKAGLTIDDIDYIVPHQANSRIVEYVAKKLKVSMEKFYLNMDRFGNTSGASIPIALSEMNDKKLLKKGQKIILVGFGAGLTWGGILIEL